MTDLERRLTGGSAEVRITAGNRLTTYRAARSAFPAVGLDPAGPWRESEKNGSEWRDSQDGRMPFGGRISRVGPRLPSISLSNNVPPVPVSRRGVSNPEPLPSPGSATWEPSRS